jgi:hypothetical protein
VRKVIGVLVAGAALVAVAALPAGAGDDAAPLHIRKVVVGPVPPGTQFVETLACEGREGNPNISSPSGPVSSVQFVFDAQGNPVGTGDTATFTGPGTCTVTETQNGGAASVSYQCEGTLPPPNGEIEVTGGRFSPRPAQNGEAEVCPSSGPQSDPITVNIISANQEATATVTNTFVDPGTPAAVAVEAVPLFTG